MQFNDMFLELFGMSYNYKEKDEKIGTQFRTVVAVVGQKRKGQEKGTQRFSKLGRAGGSYTHAHFIVTLCIFYMYYKYLCVINTQLKECRVYTHN